jgi:hypothetical protein
MSAHSVPWKIAVPSLALAALLIVAEYAWLRECRQVRRTTRANELVEEKLATARGYLREQHWNEAIHELEIALEVEDATNGDVVYPLLKEARHGQAEALLEAACIALEYRRLDDTKFLLRAYLAHPQASRTGRARLLSEDLKRALSNEEAARLLARLSDEELSVFAEKGQFTVDDGLHTEATRFFFHKTLRRNLAKELRKRQAQREVARLAAERRAAERAQRIARLRTSPAFHSLTTFLARTVEQLRDQHQIASRQEAELQALFQQLGVTKAAEQKQIRNDLLDRQSPDDIRDQVECKRAEVKRAYRNDPQFAPADGDLFDQIVDEEVDTFLKPLPSS